MSASSIRGLRLYKPTGRGDDTVELPINDNRYRVVRTILDRALLILESRPGRQALWELGREIINGQRVAGHSTMYPRPSKDPNFSQLGNYIDLFLRLMRSECPEVYLTYTRGEAAAVRYDWARIESTLQDFRPQNAGHIEMHDMIIRDMCQTSNTDDFNMYLFQMAISVAHEMGHLLTCFLTGGSRPSTPETVRVPGMAVEAGFWWEARALGGIVEFYSDPRRRDSLDQPGIPYIFTDGHHKSPGRRVSLRYIESLVAGANGFSLPIVVSSQYAPESRKQLEVISRKMSDIREEATRSRPSGNSNQASSSRHIGRVPVWQSSSSLRRYY